VVTSSRAEVYSEAATATAAAQIDRIKYLMTVLLSSTVKHD
jgi:hypothetical protein